MQNQTTRKREHFLPFSSFRVSLFLCFSHLRASLIASLIIDCGVFLLSAKTAFLLCAFLPFSPFSRFRFFPFSCLAFPPFSPFSGFRVFVFRRRHPRGRDTDFVCTEDGSVLPFEEGRFYIVCIRLTWLKLTSCKSSR